LLPFSTCRGWPIRRTRLVCCACAASGNAAAPSSVIGPAEAGTKSH